MQQMLNSVKVLHKDLKNQLVQKEQEFDKQRDNERVSIDEMKQQIDRKQ